VDKKEDWGREKEMEVDHRKVEEIVPKKFHKWLKVFRKVESERMPVFFFFFFFLKNIKQGARAVPLGFFL